MRTESSSPASRSTLRRGAGAVGLILALPLFALVIGLAIVCSFLIGPLAIAVWFGLGVLGSFLISRRVTRNGAAAARPAAVLLAVSAFAFTAATGCDIVLSFYALGDDTVTVDPDRLRARIILVAAWALATLIWTAGVVVSRRRYRIGQPTVVVAIITGLLMGASLIASWFVTAGASGVG